jgi:hypothetical protein
MLCFLVSRIPDKLSTMAARRRGMEDEKGKEEKTEKKR